MTREQLGLVVRRAAELAAADVDAEERLTEAEVIRIAAELGLPAAHVQRALYELPHRDPATSLLDRYVGVPCITSTRILKDEPSRALERLVEHLASDEYFAIRRRRVDYAQLAPAEDTMSRFARRLHGASRDVLYRSRCVDVTVRPLGASRAHVRLDVDYGDRRSGAVTLGVVGGSFAGLGTAGAIAALTVPLGLSAFGPEVTAAAVAFSSLAGLGVGAGVALRVARNRLHRLLDAARTEAEGLLDRLERNQPMREPQTPWRRRFERSFRSKAD
ncbi:MAG: hypothetical protein ACRELD_02850 [Longimicrobiales bacterium]